MNIRAVAIRSSQATPGTLLGQTKKVTKPFGQTKKSKKFPVELPPGPRVLLYLFS